MFWLGLCVGILITLILIIGACGIAYFQKKKKIINITQHFEETIKNRFNNL